MHRTRRGGVRLVSIRKILRALPLLVAVVLGGGKACGEVMSVRLQLFPFTGEVRLLNDNPNPFSFTFYSLESASGALNGADGVWTSISDTYDFSGNGFISTSINEWIELASGPTELTEAAFPDTSGTLPAFRAVSFGRIWDPNAVPGHDVLAQFVQANGMDAVVSIVEAIDGNYFEGDHEVNDLDYDVWKGSFGETSAYFADGNLDGIVDAADYTVWRDNVGLSLPGSGDGASGAVGGGLSAVAAPEPSALILFIAVGGWLSLRARRLKTAVS